MTTVCRRCSHDDDWAKASLFVLANKRELHPSFGTVGMLTLLYSFITEGHMLYGTDDDNRVIWVLAYYQGTPEEEFKNTDVLFVNIAILDRAYRRTREFLTGFRRIVEMMMEDHPEVQEFRFAALTDNAYLCRLYSKFAEAQYVRQGELGEETVFCVKIHELKGTLDRLFKV